MDLDYPWSILGIAPTSDGKAIRRAYAARLKVTRPDEDAAGFQALVEARDLALDRSRFMSRRADVEPQLHEQATEIMPAPAEPERVVSAAPDASPVLLVKARAGNPELREARSGGSDEDIGHVDASELPLPSGIAEDEPEPDIEDLLGAVGKSHPWRDLKTQWADVFDALELARLADYPEAMWRVVNKLSADLSRAVGELPDISTWEVDPSIDGKRFLGSYRDILADFESRFDFLRHDTMLFDYLDDADAHEFIKALTLAVGRARIERPLNLREINVETVNSAYVQAAWAWDEKMRAYYQAAREKDSFPRAFSWLGLLFPLPFALYYRLYGIAALVIILSAANDLVHVIWSRGGNVAVGKLALPVYLIVAFAFAFNWRRIRLHALGQQAKKLTANGFSSSEIVEKLRIWGQPSRAGIAVGVAVMILMAAARVYFR
ncbi:hypothetical protein IHQ71_16700 [Rhizobium sp. TH2]|uniref:hypothetical protein n=1 Tax=Rhizobium sp. TH2 TaxID=2775403 RepID=UPI0021570947|nr:hypothetical protein [Rhizobium sp. TH2]UVC12141.1 hypothetical protein IHQ71_16700 [Rhizobium sp. TH2]